MDKAKHSFTWNFHPTGMTKRNISLKYDDNFKQKVHGKKVNFNQEIFFNLTSNSQERNYNKFIIENGANQHLDVWEKKEVYNNVEDQMWKVLSR